MPATTSAQQHLALSQTVIERLLPMTTPFSNADKALREYLLAAWLEKLQALQELERHAEAAQTAGALASRPSHRCRR